MDDIVGVRISELNGKISELYNMRNSYLPKIANTRKSEGPCTESLKLFDNEINNNYLNQMKQVLDATINFLEDARDNLAPL